MELLNLHVAEGAVLSEPNWVHGMVMCHEVDLLNGCVGQLGDGLIWIWHQSQSLLHEDVQL